MWWRRAAAGSPWVMKVVGGEDAVVIGLNKEAFEQLQVEKKLEIIPGAMHLFEEPGALEEVADLARQWCERYLAPATAPAEAD